MVEIVVSSRRRGHDALTRVCITFGSGNSKVDPSNPLGTHQWKSAP